MTTNDARLDNKNSGCRWSRPLLQGILPLDKSRIAPDIIAGITLAALGIPEVMGSTKIIGTPVITGLYTMVLPMLVFALFGSSRHLVVGTDSATAAIVAAALVSIVAPSSPQYVALTSLVALTSGAYYCWPGSCGWDFLLISSRELFWSASSPQLASRSPARNCPALWA
jgi:MFS superfamily sulfate permease-like transporter